MSHIPASAMPHAKPVDDEHADTVATTGGKEGTTADTTLEEKVTSGAKAVTKTAGEHPWLGAVAIGGALALGAIAIALPMLRPEESADAPKSKKKRKSRS